MTVAIVSIWLPESPGQPDRFIGSGILLDATCILTAAHVVGARPEVLVRLVPGRARGLLARPVKRHDLYDAMLLRFVEGEALGTYPLPVLASGYVSETRRQRVCLHAISPATFDLHSDEIHEISGYDTSRRQYELTPAVTHGNSGGALVGDGVVLGLIVSTLGNEPLARALSMHAIKQWLATLMAENAVSTNGAAEGNHLVKDTARPIQVQPTGPEGPRGLSHKIDSVHLHVDGARQGAFVRAMVRRHSEAGLKAKLSGVAAFVRAWQRDQEDMRETYQVHTPGAAGVEDLDSFSTTQLFCGDGTLDIAQLQHITRHTNDVLVELDELSDSADGTVVELERVVGTVDENGNAQVSDTPCLRDSPLFGQGMLRHLLFSPFNDPDRTRSQPRYEYHFSIDVAREPEVEPPELERLQEVVAAAGLPIGGWFRFQDAKRWAFRSNGFGSELSAELLKEHWSVLRRKLDAQPCEQLKAAPLRLLAEELLAVWRTPLVPDQGILAVPRMARWERSRPELQEFWVILPNFLGDRNPRVMAAMAENLGKDVRYCHFLRTHADAKRWLEFRRSMAERVPQAEELMQAVVLGTNDPMFWVHNASFIANPPPFTVRWMTETDAAPSPRRTEGIRLIRTDPVSDQIMIGGIPMHEAKLQEIINSMRPVLRGGKVTSWYVVTPDGPETQVAAVCMSLPCEPDPTEFDVLDIEFANAASSERGEVASYGRRSITLVFDDHNGSGLERAVRCVRKMQETIATLCLKGRLAAGHEGRFGIDVGIARKVVRAMAPMWSGEVLVSCRDVLSRAPARAGLYFGNAASRALRPVARHLDLAISTPFGGAPAEARARASATS